MIPTPFQGIRTFCKATTNEELPYCVIGLPSDTSAAFRSGSRFGPSSIRDASAILSDQIHSKFSTFIPDYVSDVGDVALNIANPNSVLDEVEAATNNVLAWEKHPVFIGGDHSNTLGILRAINKKYGRIALLNFDAHNDVKIEKPEDSFQHGTWLFSALAENLIDATKTISIGIRNPVSEIGGSHLHAFGGTIFTARYAMGDILAVISNIRSIIGDTPVFLSFDMDVFDPSYAPGVGNPEIAGLSTMFVIELLEEIWDLNFIGMDIVEVCPQYDHSNITSLAAATIIWMYLSMVICKNEILLKYNNENNDVK